MYKFANRATKRHGFSCTRILRVMCELLEQMSGKF